MNWTVPVAVVPVMSAEKVTCCPTTEGLTDELTVTVVVVTCAIAWPDNRQNRTIAKSLLMQDFMCSLMDSVLDMVSERASP